MTNRNNWCETLIVECPSFSSVCDTIKMDRGTSRLAHRRFPLRFIFSNCHEDIRKLEEYLVKEMNAHVLDVASLLVGNSDKWPTKDEVCELLRNISHDTVVLSLSEYLRFLNSADFSTFLYSISSIEKQDIRIYIPVLGLWERFYNMFWNVFYRKKEWAPVWRITAENMKEIRVYFLRFVSPSDFENVELPGVKVVRSVYEWFNTYRESGVEKIILVSKTLNMLSDNVLPDRVFDFKAISNYKQFLEEIYSFGDIPMDYIENEQKHWAKLVRLLNREGGTSHKDFMNFVNRYLNVHDIALCDLSMLLGSIKQWDEFKIWLVAKILPKIGSVGEYSKMCLMSLKEFTHEALINEFWFRIFSLDPERVDSAIYNERRSILKEVGKLFPDLIEAISPNLTEELRRRLENVDKKQALKYLTGTTSYERKFMVKLLSEAEQSETELKEGLIEVYPELDYYMNWEMIKLDGDIPDWLVRYFTLYNLSKVKNKKHKEIEDILNEKNKNADSFSDWYYSLVYAPKLVEDKLKEIGINKTRCIWVDGLGAEWLPLIVQLVENSGKARVVFKTLVRISLPSITPCNKYEFEKISELDKFIHSMASYKYPDSLVDEIEIIKKIVNRILGYPEEKILVTSDHGFSFLCTREHGNFKVFDLETEHEGRVAFINDTRGECMSDEYYMVWDVVEGTCIDSDKRKKALIPLKHFSLSDKVPSREVHGGATPEEAVVPLFIIEKEKERLSAHKDYSIKFEAEEISIQNPVLKFVVEPKPEKIIVRIDGKKVDFKIGKTQNEFVLSLDRYRAGKHVLTLEIDDKRYEHNITVYGGFKERELF